jgi:hypothetical protein
MSALTKQGKESNKIIPKSKLIDGHYYIGRTFQRGMPIGMWDASEEKFWCIRMEYNIGYVTYINHIEDDNGLVCFEPVKEIEL